MLNNIKKRVLILFILMGVTGISQAQSLSDTHMVFGINGLLWTVTLVMGGLLLFLIFVMMRMIKVLKEDRSGVLKVEKPSAWERLLSLRPMSEEKNLVMDHTYDGIYELDNPTPPWFSFLFYGTIVIAIIYMVKYHVIGDGNIMENEYQAEMEHWEVKTANYLAQQTDLIDETNVKLVTDSKILTNTKDLFLAQCAQCHGELGEGKNGPNLTDNYWIHGGELSEIFKTIKQGVPEKGMISWKGRLKPDEIQNMASYILSIKGTVPEGVGAGPQGTHVDENRDTPKADSTGIDKAG